MDSGQDSSGGAAPPPVLDFGGGGRSPLLSAAAVVPNAANAGAPAAAAAHAATTAAPPNELRRLSLSRSGTTSPTAAAAAATRTHTAAAAAAAVAAEARVPTPVALHSRVGTVRPAPQQERQAANAGGGSGGAAQRARFFDNAVPPEDPVFPVAAPPQRVVVPRPLAAPDNGQRQQDDSEDWEDAEDGPERRRDRGGNERVAEDARVEEARVEVVRGARVATAEECRVRKLFHNRPRRTLTTRPLVTSNVVMDRPWWTQSLCYLPLLVPCMRNAFYAAPPPVMGRKAWESEVSHPVTPSFVCSNTVSNAAAAGMEEQQMVEVPPAPQESAAVYYVPTNVRRMPMLTGEAADDPSATVVNPFDGSEALAAAAGGRYRPRRRVTTPPSAATYNCMHLLYRCFCVRCAVAAQAEAMQADAKLRGAEPRPFPCCACLGLERRSYSNLLCAMCVVDALTLGLPCGCCCYHGVGTALFGCHLRFLLRARYRIFSCTALDLLVMCCLPGLAVDQQGAELALNGIPERVVGLQFMS